MLGVLIALLVIWLGQGQAAVSRSVGFRGLVILSIVPAVLAVVGLAVLARETPLPAEHRASPQLESRPRSIAGFRCSWRSWCCSRWAIRPTPSWSCRAQQAGLPVPGILGMVLSYNLVYSLLSGPAGALSDRIGRRTSADRRMDCLCRDLPRLRPDHRRLAGLGPDDALRRLRRLLRRRGQGLRRRPRSPAQRGTAYGIFHTAVGLAALPASLIAGILWEGLGSWPGWGPSAPFYFGASLASRHHFF